VKNFSTASSLVITCAALSLAGCAVQHVWVTVRPQFDFQKIKTLAVVPFDNQSAAPDAGRVMADKLSSLLSQRGIYKVVSGSRPVAPQAAGGDMTPQAVQEICKSLGADALLDGTVEHYKADQAHEVRFYDENFGIDLDEPAHAYHYEEVPEDWFRIDATVEASIRLHAVSTGQVIWRDSRVGTASSYGSPPPLDKEDVLDRASDSAARKLLLGLIPHEMKVRVPRGTLVTCAEYIDHPVDIRTVFTPRDTSLYVVIELDRNYAGKEIILRVDKADTESLIFEDRHTWSAEDDTYAVREDLSSLIQKGGFGRYRASYTLDGKRITEHDFYLREK